MVRNPPRISEYIPSGNGLGLHCSDGELTSALRFIYKSGAYFPCQGHIRLTSQRLGQLQAKLDSDANITRKDIATLLQHGNLWLARAKAQRLVHDDAIGDLVEALEMVLGTLLERFPELNSRYLSLFTSPIAFVFDSWVR